MGHPDSSSQSEPQDFSSLPPSPVGVLGEEVGAEPQL